MSQVVGHETVMHASFGPAGGAVRNRSAKRNKFILNMKQSEKFQFQLLTQKVVLTTSKVYLASFDV